MRFLIKKEELERLIDGAPYLAPYREKAKELLNIYMTEETDYFIQKIGNVIYYAHTYLTKLSSGAFPSSHSRNAPARGKFILDNEGTAWAVIEYVVGNRKENLIILNEHEDLTLEELKARIDAAYKYIATLTETYTKFNRITNKGIIVLHEAFDKAGIERKNRQSMDFEAGYKKISGPNHAILHAVSTLKEIADVVKKHESDKENSD